MKMFLRKILSQLLVIFNGNASVANFILWPLSKRALGGYKEVVDIGDGVKMPLFNEMPDMVNKTLLFYSGKRKYAWEPATTRLFNKILVNKKSVCIAGTHLGYYCLIAALNNPSVKIYGFEPVAEIYEKFLANIKLNKFNNITATNAALSDKTGVSYVTNDNAQSSLMDEPGILGEKIGTHSIDDFFKDKEKLDLILLDVEGYELFVFNGAKETLKSKPDIIFEVNNKMLAKNKADATSLLNLLSEHGYRFFFVDDEYELPDLSNNFSQINLREISYQSIKNINASFYNVLATLKNEGELTAMGVNFLKQ